MVSEIQEIMFQSPQRRSGVICCGSLAASFPVLVGFVDRISETGNGVVARTVIFIAVEKGIMIYPKRLQSWCYDQL
jgi:hypothetical protein